jgi:hypothetical protein
MAIISHRFWEMIFNFLVGFIFLFFSLCLMVLGSRLLPVVGFILAAPTLWVAFKFYGKPLSEKNSK